MSDDPVWKKFHISLHLSLTNYTEFRNLKSHLAGSRPSGGVHAELEAFTVRVIGHGLHPGGEPYRVRLDGVVREPLHLDRGEEEGEGKGEEEGES